MQARHEARHEARRSLYYYQQEKRVVVVVHLFSLLSRPSDKFTWGKWKFSTRAREIIALEIPPKAPPKSHQMSKEQRFANSIQIQNSPAVVNSLFYIYVNLLLTAQFSLAPLSCKHGSKSRQQDQPSPLISA